MAMPATEALLIGCDPTDGGAAVLDRVDSIVPVMVECVDEIEVGVEVVVNEDVVEVVIVVGGVVGGVIGCVVGCILGCVVGWFVGRCERVC